MMIPSQAEARRLAAQLTKEAGRAVNASEVMDGLADFDEVAAAAEEEALFVSETWDGTSPINGVPADEVRQHHAIPADGTVGIVREVASGQVVVFQPHPPEKPVDTRMTPAVARDTVVAMVKDRGQAAARAKMQQHLRNKVGVDPVAAERARRQDAEVERRVREELNRERERVRAEVRREETERIIAEARAR